MSWVKEVKTWTFWRTWSVKSNERLAKRAQAMTIHMTWRLQKVVASQRQLTSKQAHLSCRYHSRLSKLSDKWWKLASFWTAIRTLQLFRIVQSRWQVSPIKSIDRIAAQRYRQLRFHCCQIRANMDRQVVHLWPMHSSNSRECWTTKLVQAWRRKSLAK